MIKQLTIQDFDKIAEEIKVLTQEIIKNIWEIAKRLKIIKDLGQKWLDEKGYKNFEQFIGDYYGWAKAEGNNYVRAMELANRLAIDFKEDIGISTACALNTLYELNEQKALELYKQKKDRRFIELVIKEIKEDINAGKGFNLDRPLVEWDDGFYYLSEINHKEVRQDAYHTIKEGELYPTLKRRSWFFHEDGSEFSLREYASVQEFPEDYKFVGTKEKIKDQIGNAVAPPMAKHISQFVKGKNLIELFAGCGGSSTGFMQGGWDCLWMNERNAYACMTFKLNHPKTFINNLDIKKVSCDRIKKETSNKKIDLIFGGVPCQGFSLSGLKFKDDPRNELYKEFVRVVNGIKPQYFIMENVMGIKPYKEQIIKDFEGVGYKVEFKEVKGEEIGMKQKRHRCFFIGGKK